MSPISAPSVNASTQPTPGAVSRIAINGWSAPLRRNWRLTRSISASKPKVRRCEDGPGEPMTDDPPHLPRLRKVESPGTHVHWRRTDDGRYLAEFWQNPPGRGRGGKWHIRVTDTHTN